MPKFRTGLIAAAAALVVGTSAILAAPSAVSAAPSAPPAPRGIEKLHTQVDLPAGAWRDTVQVRLPRAGTYELDADVRGRLSGTPPVNTYITARLWNATTGTEVPESARLIYQIIDGNPGNAYAGGNQTTPISELVQVTGPTTISLQAQRFDARGTAGVAQIYSDTRGYTSLRFNRIAP
ncbi:hypothetical protein [Streptomyces virginiae]|uniref:hypothetical protein n=1 Tax=Streptomyces virginiae TaxID=1961 RepID=UPI00343EA5AE